MGEEEFAAVFFKEYREILAVLFATGLVLAVVSHFATEQILHAFLYDKKKELRWRTTLFFVVDLMLVLLFYYHGVRDREVEFSTVLLDAVVISSVSLAVYTALPAITKKYTGMTLTVDSEKESEEKKDGNEKQTSD